ncbi:MAG: hypothetical protein RL011_775, partial [Pseudomonadota bacterium]
MTTPEGLSGSDGAGMTATQVTMVTAK